MQNMPYALRCQTQYVHDRRNYFGNTSINLVNDMQVVGLYGKINLTYTA